MTLHGTLMVFSCDAGAADAFGTLCCRNSWRLRDAFPRLIWLSFWTTSFRSPVIGFVHLPGGGPLSGWTAYPPLSALGPIAGPGQGWGSALVLQYWRFSRGDGYIDQFHRYRDANCALRYDDANALPCWNWFVTAIIKFALVSGAVCRRALILLTGWRGPASSCLPRAALLALAAPLWFLGIPSLIAICRHGDCDRMLFRSNSGADIRYRAMVYARCHRVPGMRYGTPLCSQAA